jgi:hypothetical protein
MTVATAWTRRDKLHTVKVVLKKMTYDNGDTSIAVNTGLSKIFSYDVSTPAVTAKAVDYATIAGGTITIHVANPLAPDYLYVRAFGL